MAIEDSVQKALPVKEIYAWIIQHFPYFKTAPTGWKNSVRHNLSLNKCFQKVEKAAVSVKRNLKLSSKLIHERIFFAESRKRLAVDGGTAISTQPYSSANAFAFSPVLHLGEARKKPHQDTK